MPVESVEELKSEAKRLGFFVHPIAAALSAQAMATAAWVKVAKQKTDKRAQEFRRLVEEEGLSRTAAARALGYKGGGGNSGATFLARAAGMSFRPSTKLGAEERRAKVLKLHEEGLSDREIARRIGLSPGGARNIRTRAGLPSNTTRRRRPKKTTPFEKETE